MPLNIVHASPQSSNMLTQSTGATWQIIYLVSPQETRKNPLIIRLVLLTPKCSQSLVENLPHVLATSYDAAATIFSYSCTERAAYLGKHSTSCIETPEDVWPTIFNPANRRNDSLDLAVYSPHAFQHFKYPSAIFKHAFTKRFHNRVRNLSSLMGISEDVPIKECPAYTEVVRLT